jgi:hypothetical protein
LAHEGTAPKKRSAKQDRSMRWGILKTQVQTSKSREAEARRARKLELVEARDACETKKKTVKQECAADRVNVRTAARRKLEREKALRMEKRDNYREAVGQRERQARKRVSYTRKESDSLAEHSIAPELVGLWRSERRRFSYELEPDHRAELFGEWTEAHPHELAQYQAEQVPEESELAAGYAAWLADFAEGAPF